MREYSTRGGTSSYEARCTMPSASSSRRWAASTFSVIPGTWRRSAPKRRLGRSPRAQRISTFHLPPITSIAASIPHTCAPGLALVAMSCPRPSADLLAHLRVTTHSEVRT
ncbi:hypothetical protein VR45_19290 [Streptomyces sp. NRRL S-495]|nr:hypothetical protein VR45_19290 [Streptomyces sp. NRRL S-495]